MRTARLVPTGLGQGRLIVPMGWLGMVLLMFDTSDCVAEKSGVDTRERELVRGG